MDAHGRVADAEEFAQSAFQVAGIAFGHALGVADEKDEGRRRGFGLGKVEELGTYRLTTGG